ncbi:hypothetical protein EIP91_009952 [Steccherinum ochraceum]|uniref:Uncharacterized protein n=1 Tax=Steccherinum ochraceum TaxID=92696 RepID=A0A4R0R3B2_9APHY|nr:hypothetical protein EIP91_009952 [Steccherinum ochraceum]
MSSEYMLDSCRHVQLYHQLYSAFATLIVGVLVIIRTYALYERSRKVLIFLLGLMTTSWVIACWAVAAGSSSTFDPVGHAFTLGFCDLSLSAIEGKYFAGAWSTVLLFDFVVFVLTLYKRLRVGKTHDNGLFSLMVRDGTVYFGVIAILFSIDIVTFLVTGALYKGIVITYTNVLSSILMSRMMLNVRRPSLPRRQQSTAPFSTIAYARTNDRPYTSTVADELTIVVDETATVRTQPGVSDV